MSRPLDMKPEECNGVVGDGDRYEEEALRTAHRLLVLVAGGVWAAVGIALMAFGSRIVLGWGVFVAAAAVLFVLAGTMLPPHLRVASAWVVSGLSIVLLLTLSPGVGVYSDFTLFGWIGLLCAFFPAAFLTAVLVAFVPMLKRNRRDLVLLPSITAILVALAVAEPMALKVRISLRLPAFDQAARDAGGPGGPQVAFGEEQTVHLVGLPVAYGGHGPDGEAEFCLSGGYGWCPEALVYSPDLNLDGDRSEWNVDCDTVTRLITGDWYLRDLECPRG